MSGSRCLWHAPEKRGELAEAQRLGGLRRRKERTIATAYDVASLRSPADIWRLLEILVIDALSMDNTPARGRLLNALAITALKLHDAARFDDVD